MVEFSLPREAVEVLLGPIADDQAELLSAYGSAIVEASERLNLVSRRSLGDVGEHIVDSAALLTFVDIEESGLADLGSGAGFPGVVAAILRPAAEVVLVDARRSKVVFLKEMKRMLGLDNVTVIHERLEDLDGRVEYELAAARALGDVKTILPTCLRLLKPGGRLVLFKGPRWAGESEWAADAAGLAGAEIARTSTVVLPGFSRSTTFVEFHVKRA